jgi:hypothetical protein
VGTWLENRIRDAVLALRWRREGESLHPDYFIGSPPDSLQFRNSTASYLAHFIAERIAFEVEEWEQEEQLDKYGLEVIASYLEEHGYIVTSPY